jgi:ferredoxin-NADP reductase
VTETSSEFELVASRILDEAEGVRSVLLRDRDGRELPPWAPGAHLDLIIRPDLERQYSLCGDLDDRHAWRIAVLREPESRGGSAWVHSELTEGDVVRVRGPRNHFPLVSADRYVFVAGGIGITPLIPMIETVAATESSWDLLYGGRTGASMAFVEELRRHGERVSFRPENEHGLLDLDAALGQPVPGTAIYCCGPEPLIAAVEARCSAWPAGALHVERFHPRPHALEGPDTAFDVVIASSDLTVRVGAGQSIVDALATVGIKVPTSCREGTCGTCETGVLDGLPDHRDSFLSEEEREENEVMMICCGRSLTPTLVLDL